MVREQSGFSCFDAASGSIELNRPGAGSAGAGIPPESLRVILLRAAVLVTVPHVIRDVRSPKDLDGGGDVSVGPGRTDDLYELLAGC